jgi:hypothetical protein
MNEIEHRQEERRQAALKLWNDLETLMFNLYSRWLDEKEYEDINDYAAPIKPKVEAIGGTFIKMNKRPFGFDYRLNGVTYNIFINSRGYYEYNRIP